MERTSSLSQMTVNILFLTVPFVSVMLEHQKFPKVKSVQDCQRFVYGAMDTEKKPNLTIIDFSIVKYKQRDNLEQLIYKISRCFVSRLPFLSAIS